MKVRGDNLITANFIISTLGVLVGITGAILRVVYKATGFDLSYFTPGCANNYNNIKYGFTYLSLRVQFIANIAAVVTGIISVVLLILPLMAIWKGKDQKSEQSTKNSQRQVKLEILYVSCSLCILGWVIAAGGPLNLFIQAKSCTFQGSFNSIFITIVGLSAFLLTLLSWILVICLLSTRPPQNQITYQDLKIKGEEEQLSRRIDSQIKGYVNGVTKTKADMQQELLLYQQKVYESNKKNDQSRYQDNLVNQTNKEGTEYQYYEQEVEVSNEQAVQEQDQNAKQNVQDEFNLSPAISPSLSALSRNKSQSLKKGVSKLELQMQKVPNQHQDMESNEMAQGLTPQNRNMIQLQVNSSNYNGSPEQKTPLKTKKIESNNNGWQQQLNNFNLEAVKQQPINEQMSKLLKITLFNNSPFFDSKAPKLQEQCPLQKYLQRDSRFEIPPQNKFNKKNKRIQYSKEQLIFVKKRKEKVFEDQLRCIMKEEYDQGLAIKRQRVDLLSPERIEKAETMEKERDQNIPSKYKKFNLIESIRSKCSY